MNRASITSALDALETAYEDILINVPPGTPGKIEAVTKIRDIATRMIFEFAHHNRIHNEFPDSITAA